MNDYIPTAAQLQREQLEDARSQVRIAARHLRESRDPDEWREQLADALLVILAQLERLDP